MSTLHVNEIFIALFLACALGIVSSNPRARQHSQSSAESCVDQHWGYRHGSNRKTIRPNRWSKYCPDCRGNEQSPIHIHSNRCKKDETLLPVMFIGELNGAPVFQLENNGHTLEATPEQNSAIMVGGTPYRLLQFHMHWGQLGRSTGSEHKIDNHKSQAEVHFVTFKLSYGTVEEARKHRDGLAVFSVLYSTHAHQRQYGSNYMEMNVIARALEKHTMHSTNKVNLEVYKLFPHNSGYYNYFGSLTTPPCSQVVQWFVFKEIMHLPKSFLKYAAHLKTENGAPLYDNFRATQPLNGRTVYCTAFDGQ